MKINRNEAEKVFQGYVDNYNSKDGKIKLKIDHTYRVSKICDEIAERLNLSSDDKDLAYLTGLLHDIGRFEQIKRFNTFVDAESVDHAKLGVQILFEENKIRDFIEDESEDELIEKVISNHNVYELPDNLSERELLFAKILRDADKIDIFRVNVTEPAYNVYGYSEEELKSSIVTKEVLESFKRHETVLRKLKKTPVDSVVSHIAFVFGIYFNESVSIAKEQGYFLELSRFKSENEVTKKQFLDIMKVIEEYLIMRG
ncbi:HDIG domain-containing protein [Clostridium sp. DSM 8431]|uniref:HD domain-containing protein n=1 Tax=Clostridium sp. DSM 8431 TaxID=1761781 RepID=UPI0008F44128|nr:HD domain-containing protein [Clostridium sp. DSM 8431]SFU59837.1 HDIG domain-containing protein [Clostridium sp. DSM 8431]